MLSALAWWRMGVDAWLVVPFAALVVDRRARRAADAPRGAAQLSGDRPPALPARVHPARDPPVLHRERQRGGAVLARSSARSSTSAPRASPTSARSARSSTSYADGYEWINHSMRRRTLAIARLPRARSAPSCAQPYSRERLQHLGDELRLAVGERDPRAQRRRAGAATSRTTPARARSAAYHRENGGDLIWEIGSGYFGCRDARRHASTRSASPPTRADPQVKMIEIKLSPGRQARPRRRAAGAEGDAGDRRGARRAAWASTASRRRATARSPRRSRLMQFVDAPARALGRQADRLQARASAIRGNGSASPRRCCETGITARLHRRRRRRRRHRRGAAGIHRPRRRAAAGGAAARAQHAGRRWTCATRIRIGCAGKVVSAFDIARMLALGADWCNAARGFMFALGCIQSQTCHTGNCPTGVDDAGPAARAARWSCRQGRARLQLPPATRCMALKELVQAAGLQHPGEITAHAHRAAHVASTASSCSPTCCRSSSRASLLRRRHCRSRCSATYWPIATAAQLHDRRAATRAMTATASADAPLGCGRTAAARCR